MNLPRKKENKVKVFFSFVNKLIYIIFFKELNDVLILRKEKKESDEESDLSGEEIAEGIEVPNLHKSKKRRKREEFSQWKEKVLQENLSEKTKDVNSKSLKQTTLQFSSQEKKETDTLFDDD